MNIFAVDRCPRKSAEMMLDKHIVKMPLETAQILSTVHDRYDTWVEPMYKPTHKHHPSTLWAGDDVKNYMWLFDHFVALNDEYQYRYGKTHLSFTKLSDVLCRPPSKMFVSGHDIKSYNDWWWDSMNMSFKLPTPAMPDHCKLYDDDGEIDVVASYRLYYNACKSGIARYTRRNKPDWFYMATA